MDRNEADLELRSLKPRLESAICSRNALVDKAKRIGFCQEYDDLAARVVIYNELIKDLERRVQEAEDVTYR